MKNFLIIITAVFGLMPKVAFSETLNFTVKIFGISFFSADYEDTAMQGLAQVQLPNGEAGALSGCFAGEVTANCAGDHGKTICAALLTAFTANKSVTISIRNDKKYGKECAVRWVNLGH